MPSIKLNPLDKIMSANVKKVISNKENSNKYLMKAKVVILG